MLYTSMQSYASNNGSLMNALSTRNFKCQLDSRYFTPIYKETTESVYYGNRQTFISRRSLFWSQSRLFKNRSSIRIGNIFPSEKAGFFPIFEYRKIVQKLRKTSYFWLQW